MAESYDDPYTAPGFNYQEMFRPPDDPYRDPGFNYDDYRSSQAAPASPSPFLLTAGVAGLGSLTNGTAEGLSFAAWHRQNIANDPIDVPQMGLGVNGISAGNALSMVERLRELWARTFQSRDRGMDL
jgi:hypothetical protein